MPKEIGQVIWDTYEDPLSQVLSQIEADGQHPTYFINDPDNLSTFICDEPFTWEDIRKDRGGE